MKDGHARPVGNRPGFCIELPVGVRVVFSVDEHPGGQYRHLSVSVQGRQMPAPRIVEEVMHHLGFVNQLHECSLHLEPQALNVLEPLSAGEADRLAA